MKHVLGKLFDFQESYQQNPKVFHLKGALKQTKVLNYYF